MEVMKLIPKVIHYCWFGGNELPSIANKCIESWKKYCPDYEIKEWNESNFDIKENLYAYEAYTEKKWAFVSDYARLKVVYDYGGIYLDTDVELLRAFDSLLSNSCFLGTEISTEGSYINTGLGFGAEKGNEAVKLMLDEYEGIHYMFSNGVIDTKNCPVRNTDAIKKMGYVFANNVWRRDGIAVYPPEYFSPKDYITGETKITKNSYSVHHYSALWLSDADRQMMNRISEIERKYPPILSRPMKQLIQYKNLRHQGKTECFFGYVYAKIKQKLWNTTSTGFM